MKLATLNDGSRDGQLAVVSRDLARAHFATGIATRMQELLDDWNFLSPQLEDLYATLNGGKARHAFAFEPRQCMAPLPRAYQLLEADAYPSHLARLAPSRGGPLPPLAEPRLAQVGSDDFLGPHEPVRLADPAWCLDFGAGIAAVTGDVAQGTAAAPALDAVRLLLLVNGWHLREPVAGAPDADIGAAASRPATAFAPVALTPDELGSAWRDGRLHGVLQVQCRGRRIGQCETGMPMQFHLGELIAQAARTRRLRAGSIVGTGTVGSEVREHGVACLADRRALEMLDGGAPATGFMQRDDTVRLAWVPADGSEAFGVIEQTVAAP